MGSVPNGTFLAGDLSGLALGVPGFSEDFSVVFRGGCVVV